MSGVQLEPTGDVDGVQNVGWIDPNDWMEYALDLPAAGLYTLDLRVASAPGGANALVTTNGNPVGSFSVGATGGWQSWQNVQLTVDLPAGPQTLRITSQAASWNLNWFSVQGGAASAAFAAAQPAALRSPRTQVDVFPNPAREQLNFRMQDAPRGTRLTAQVQDINGRTIITRTDLNPAGGSLDVSALRPGIYFLRLRRSDDDYDGGTQPVVRFVVH